MKNRALAVYLADDDQDDCFLFEDALAEIAANAALTTASDGLELMDLLRDSETPLPDLIFLDLNMPRKNGFECLDEIKANYAGIPVIIFSTSCEKAFIDKVYQQGADFYLCKPDNFSGLKTAISKVLTADWSNHRVQPDRNDFLITY